MKHQYIISNHLIQNDHVKYRSSGSGLEPNEKYGGFNPVNRTTTLACMFLNPFCRINNSFPRICNLFLWTSNPFSQISQPFPWCNNSYAEIHMEIGLFKNHVWSISFLCSTFTLILWVEIHINIAYVISLLYMIIVFRSAICSKILNILLASPCVSMDHYEINVSWHGCRTISMYIHV